MDEVWKQIPGYGWHYEASSLGKIRVKPRTILKPHSKTGEIKEYSYAGRLLCQFVSTGGYKRVSIGVDGKTFSINAHILIALAFHGERPDGMVACHNNGNSQDNRPENLRWDTPLENNRDRLRHGTYARGDKHPMAKIKQSDVDEIRSTGMHYLDVSRKYGLSRSQSHRITSGKNWASP